MLCISVFSHSVFADRIKDFADIAGQRPNQLVGYGLVVGLDGTGDQTTQTPFTLQSVLQMIGVHVPKDFFLMHIMYYVITLLFRRKDHTDFG